jgi:hypothetical protein
MIEMSTGEGIQGCSKGSSGAVHPPILENYVRRRHLLKKTVKNFICIQNFNRPR